jgi:hypothetical protein
MEEKLNGILDNLDDQLSSIDNLSNELNSQDYLPRDSYETQFHTYIPNIPNYFLTYTNITKKHSKFYFF